MRRAGDPVCEGLREDVHRSRRIVTSKVVGRYPNGSCAAAGCDVSRVMP